MRIPIDKRVIPGSIVIGILGLVSFIYVKPLLLLILPFLIFHLAFFRDPERTLPAGDHPLSPADGAVVAIETVQENRFLHTECYKIGIFLSVLNAHVNRSPISGTIEYWHYQKGQFLNALRSDSAELNECLWLGLQNSKRKVVTRLIAGAIARRICCDVKKGEMLERAGKLGIICYGSRAEFYVPKNQFRVLVKMGDNVKAGQTILGEWI